MKICVIHGSPRKGNTYKATKILMSRLEKRGTIEFKEFYLPKDLPNFCCGCYNCFFKGEDKCPHAQFSQPIEQAMKEADGIIITSPVYTLAESGAVKAFLDHFGYMFIPHRPMEEMFSKIGMVISTTAGAGTGKAIKTISRSMKYWGMKRIYDCGLRIFAMSWEDMKTEKQNKFEKRLEKKADKFYSSLVKRNKIHAGLFSRFMFFVMKKAILKYDDDNTDKKYWLQKGWLGGKSTPF